MEKNELDLSVCKIDDETIESDELVKLLETVTTSQKNNFIKEIDDSIIEETQKNIIKRENNRNKIIKSIKKIDKKITDDDLDYYNTEDLVIFYNNLKQEKKSIFTKIFDMIIQNGI